MPCFSAYYKGTIRTLISLLLLHSHPLPTWGSSSGTFPTLFFPCKASTVYPGSPLLETVYIPLTLYDSVFTKNCLSPKGLNFFQALSDGSLLSPSLSP